MWWTSTYFAIYFSKHILQFFFHIFCPCLVKFLHGRVSHPSGWIGCWFCSKLTKVVVNGVLGRRIQHVRGLRQGDPILPLMFVIAMDVLMVLMSKAEELGVLSSIPGIYKLQHISIYVDDVVLFLKPTSADLRLVKLIVEAFVAAWCSDLRKWSGYCLGQAFPELWHQFVPHRILGASVENNALVLWCIYTRYGINILVVTENVKKFRTLFWTNLTLCCTHKKNPWWKNCPSTSWQKKQKQNFFNKKCE